MRCKKNGAEPRIHIENGLIGNDERSSVHFSFSTEVVVERVIGTCFLKRIKQGEEV
jgi:hypothetical protein